MDAPDTTLSQGDAAAWLATMRSMNRTRQAPDSARARQYRTEAPTAIPRHIRAGRGLFRKQHP
eukprot:4941920-Prorocentrum_lima.AAC.1